MAADPTAARAPSSQQCPNCVTAVRPRDRFCAACGMRLERPDLRRETPGVPPAAGGSGPSTGAPVPMMYMPGAAVSPASAVSDRGLAAAVTAVLVVALAALALMLVLVTADSENDTPSLVTSPQVVTTP